MTLYSGAPSARDFQQDKPTLLVAWWCTLFSACIILFRVAGRYVRTERLFREDRLAFACLIPLFVRMAFVHVVLLYGTNNVTLDGLSELSIHNRGIGSRLVLASRFFYAATLWMLKLTITEFLKRLTLQIWRHSYEVTLRCIRWFLLLTFIAILLSDLLECHPFTHYWQVTPDPGPQCRQGFALFMTTAICNILTDLLLVIFPIPIIMNSSMPLKRKFSLICLFALSIIPIAFTFYQIPEIIGKKGRQQTRSLWASIEILAATAVANALVLGSFVRDRGVKKQKWKRGSLSEGLERTISQRGNIARAWGSDEDLVRDLGIGVDRELRHYRHVSHAPRPAPMATSGNDSIRYARGLTDTTTSNYSGAKTPSSHQAWDYGADRHPYANGEESSEDYDLLKMEQHRAHHDEETDDADLPSMITPRKLSFFDVGGLLEESEQPPNPQRASETYTNTTTSSTLNNFTQRLSNPFLQRQQSYPFPHPTPLSPTPQPHPFNPSPFPSSSTLGPPRKGSAALLHDLGGLITPITPPISSSLTYNPNNGNELTSSSATYTRTSSYPSLNPYPRPSPAFGTSSWSARSPPPPISIPSKTNWGQRPFSFASSGQRSHSSPESSDPFSNDAIPMRPIRSGSAVAANGTLRGDGGV